jgi:hypothetical protein
MSLQLKDLRAIAAQELGPMSQAEVSKAIESGMSEAYFVLAAAMPTIIRALVRRAAHDPITARYLATLFMKMPAPKEDTSNDPFIRIADELARRRSVAGADGSSPLSPVVEGQFSTVQDSLPPGPA